MLFKKTLFLCLILPTISFCMENDEDSFEKLLKAASLGSNNLEAAAKVLFAQRKISEDQYKIFREERGTKYLKPALRDGWIHHWKGFGEGWGKGVGEVVSEIGKIIFVPAAHGLADSFYGTSLEQQIQLRTVQSQLVAQKMPLINQIANEFQQEIEFCKKELDRTDLDKETEAFYIKTKNTAQQKLDEVMQKSYKYREQELDTVDFSLALVKNNTRKGLIGTITAWWNKPNPPVNDNENIPVN